MDYTPEEEEFLHWLRANDARIRTLLAAGRRSDAVGFVFGAGNNEPRRKCLVAFRKASGIPVTDPHHYETVGGKRVRLRGRRHKYAGAHKRRTVVAEDRSRVTENTDRIEVGKTISLNVNESVMWKYFAKNSYGEGSRLARYAMREAFQNSRDAVYALGKGKTGRIDIDIGHDSNTIEFSDTGIGMTPEVLVDKFLTLGQTGKGGERGAIGGFGVAKAVILSMADPEKRGRWDITTNGVGLAMEELGKTSSLRRVPQTETGTSIRWENVEKRIMDSMNGRGSLGGLQWSDWDERRLNVYVHNMLQGPLDGGPTGTVKLKPLRLKNRPMAQVYNGETMVQLRRVKINKVNEHREGAQRLAVPKTGNVIVRLDGLVQTTFHHGAPGLYVVDLKTTAKPTDANYPFDPHRLTLDWEISNWVRERLDPLITETLSGDRERPDHRLGAGFLRVKRGRTNTKSVRRFVTAIKEEYKRLDKIAKRGRQASLYGHMMGDWGNRFHVNYDSTDLSEYGALEQIEPEQTGDDRLAEQLAENTMVKGNYYDLTEDEAVRLQMFRWFVSACATRLAGKVTHANVYGIRSDPTIVAELRRTDNQDAVGINLPRLNKATSPRRIFALFLAETQHELAHLVETQHNETFTSAQGEIMRDTNMIAQQLMDTTKRLWKTYVDENRPAGTRAPTKKKRRRSKRRATPQAAGQGTLFASTARKSFRIQKGIPNRKDTYHYEFRGRSKKRVPGKRRDEEPTKAFPAKGQLWRGGDEHIGEHRPMMFFAVGEPLEDYGRELAERYARMEGTQDRPTGHVILATPKRQLRLLDKSADVGYHEEDDDALASALKEKGYDGIYRLDGGTEAVVGITSHAQHELDIEWM